MSQNLTIGKPKTQFMQMNAIEDIFQIIKFIGFDTPIPVSGKKGLVTCFFLRNLPVLKEVTMGSSGLKIELIKVGKEGDTTSTYPYINMKTRNENIRMVFSTSFQLVSWLACSRLQRLHKALCLGWHLQW